MWKHFWVFPHVGFFLARFRLTAEIQGRNDAGQSLERTFRQASNDGFVDPGMKVKTMRRSMNEFVNLNVRHGTALICARVRQVACLSVVGGVLVASQAFAKDPVQPEAKPTSKLIPATTADAPAIPECLEKLKLSQQQETQAKEIIRTYDVKLNAVWKQFGEKYMETVRTEVSLLAAVEDNLTESQRTIVRGQRRKMAHTELAMQGTASKLNQATAKATDPVDQAVSGAGITLSSEQEAMADKIQEKHASHLRSLNRDIQGIHNRLVSLEADKHVELEKLLTKEQLVQLREERLTMAAGQKVTAAEKSAKRTE